MRRGALFCPEEMRCWLRSTLSCRPADSRFDEDGVCAISIERSPEWFALHPEALPVLCERFEAGWPAYYGPGGRAGAADELQAGPTPSKREILVHANSVQALSIAAN